MIFNMTNGGGGTAALSFKVVAYESVEALQTSTPKENTIGVVTTTPITSWTFSVTEPSNIESGMAWFIVDYESNVEFNALNKNSIQIKPRRTKQFIDGEWTNVLTWIYQDSEWKEWINRLYLYNVGSTCDNVTGGWTGASNSDGMLIASGNIFYSYTENMVKVDEYKNLYIDISAVTGPPNGFLAIGLSYTKENKIDDYVAVYTEGSETWFGSTGTKIVDISNVSGSYYLKIHGYTIHPLKISKIYME